MCSVESVFHGVTSFLQQSDRLDDGDNHEKKLPFLKKIDPSFFEITVKYGMMGMLAVPCAIVSLDKMLQLCWRFVLG